MAEGKRDGQRAASPAEVARTLLEKSLSPSGFTLETKVAPDPAATVEAGESGVRPSRRDVETVSSFGRQPTEPPPPPLPADDRYSHVTMLGEGGMGRVDEAFDRVLGRAVARKSLHAESKDDRALMLVAEAQTCAQLEHPSIVPVYDLTANADGTPCYTMRVVRGRTLKDVLLDNEDPNKEHMPFAQLLGVFRQVCLAVDYAHSKGVVHRDIKPDNVIVGEFGEVYVVDWGIAHVTEGSVVQRAGVGPMIAGTPAYMAPEQLLGGEVDGRADVFALGVILYEMIAGSRPFEDESIRGVHARRKQMVDVPPSRRTERPAAPGFFDDLVLACLAPSRTHRPGRPRVIAAAIDEFLDAERANAERERDATQHVADAEAAWGDLERLDAEARRLEETADKALAALPTWDGADKKDSAWALATRARKLRSEAAQAAARAETELMRAIGRVSHHRPARRALAKLYFRQFTAAERASDEERMTQFMDLARAYDDGDLALELANRGELIVESDRPGAVVHAARYEPSGPLLRVGAPIELGITPTSPLVLASGSYLVTAILDGIEVRYALCLVRAKTHRLKLRIPRPNEIPDGMVLVPGGRFLSIAANGQKVEEHLPDFAIARFPVTCGQYAEWLSTLGPEELERRVPKNMSGVPLLVRNGARWELQPTVIEGPARAHVPPGTELSIPVMDVTWYDAVAYAKWRSRESGRPYRLPTALEWDKAMRGADGRRFPMGVSLDPSFAKLRESRAEAPQPEPIGAFPLDESPYGVRDLAGGVGDWTASGADGVPLALEGAELDDDRQAIWRGGTWSTTAGSHHSFRYLQSARTIGDWIGFRHALSLEESGSSELSIDPMRR
jgi:formylglycine-generating enzyme required for sulfatase activity